MKLSVNDWQDFSLKKDIEKLNKLVQRACDVGSTIVFDIVVAFGAVIFDRLFDFADHKIAVVIYIVTFFLIIASLARLFFIKIKAFLHGELTFIASRSIREYIDSFDNEIWCYVMMSDSFLDLLTDNITADDNRKTFYYSQTCFWLNKAIIKLFEMSQKLEKIFDDDNGKVKRNRKVSIARLINLLDIIFNIKEAVENKKGDLTLSDEDLTSNKLYHETLNDFLSKVHEDLRVDIERFRNDANNNV